MAVPTNIKTLLSGSVVEWARIEFKEIWDAEASLKTICAFANDIDNWGGGYIVIGVKEKDGRQHYIDGAGEASRDQAPPNDRGCRRAGGGDRDSDLRL